MLVSIKNNQIDFILDISNTDYIYYSITRGPEHKYVSKSDIVKLTNEEKQGIIAQLTCEGKKFNNILQYHPIDPEGFKLMISLLLVEKGILANK